MKTPVIALCAALAYTGGASAFDINAYCKGIVGNSYSLEKVCRDQENKAKAALSRMSIPAKIDSYCQGLVDSYGLMLVCVKQESEAKAALGKTNERPAIPRSSGKPDPTRPSVTQAQPTSANHQGAYRAQIVIAAEGRQLAMINGVYYREGDAIAASHYQVVSIAHREVVVRDPSAPQSRTVRLVVGGDAHPLP